MIIYVTGNLLSCSESEFEGQKQRVVKLLQDDEIVRVKFKDANTVPMFESCKKLDKMAEVQICCKTTLFDGRLYLNAYKE